MDTARNRRIGSTGNGPAGRVTVDSRGRNVWQWNDGQTDSTTIMLARLENHSLAIEPTLSLRQPKLDPAGRETPGRGDSGRFDAQDLAIEPTISVKIGGGFDPYNSA
jgi:hypothetical protein